MFGRKVCRGIDTARGHQAQAEPLTAVLSLSVASHHTGSDHRRHDRERRHSPSVRGRHRPLWLRRNVANPIHQERHASRYLLQLSPVLHRPAEAARYRGSRRAVHQEFGAQTAEQRKTAAKTAKAAKATKAKTAKKPASRGELRPPNSLIEGGYQAAPLRVTAILRSRPAQTIFRVIAPASPWVRPRRRGRGFERSEVAQAMLMIDRERFSCIVAKARGAAREVEELLPRRRRLGIGRPRRRRIASRRSASA